MNVSDPTRRVSVVSTGQVQIRRDHEASSWRPTIWWLLASRSWTRHDLDDLYLGLRSAPTLVPQISGDPTPGRSHQRKLHSMVNSGIAS
jgi:hypothetical protein